MQQQEVSFNRFNLKLRKASTMTTSQIADDVRVSVQLSSPGHDENDRTNLPGSFRSSSSTFLRAVLQLLGEAEEVKKKSTVNSTSLKSAKQVNVSCHGKCSQNKEDAGEVFECQSGGCGFYIGDQWHHHPQCWTNKYRNRFVETLLMVSSFLLSFATAGAFYFTQALTVAGSHDTVLKHSLAAFNGVFTASFFCNFMGVLVCLILQSRREYHQYKKISLIISNAASFLFMVLGYGLVIAFNIQRR
ncbi:hypothetical protein MKW98_019710 [Papaver atlanticum]|uniref:Uncharacterized protein n=1 Tax=Papaver atlanticum TaxID=357466 RepID=A0AAD4TF77_9MAGN|nr:hypothetical protein MKW98_019710 [Papaver atlanticum]